MSSAGTETTTDGDEATPMLVDCDVHPSWHSEEEILGRLPKHYQQVDRGLHLYSGGMWTNPIGFSAGGGGHDVEGHPATTPEQVRELHLDDVGVDYCLLNGDLILHVSVFPNHDYAAEVARAHNEWLREEWFPTDDRFLGSIVVAPQNPQQAAEEIRRLGDHPQFVQVLMGATSQVPYGNPQYWPIYEAAVECGLPVGIHPGTHGRGIGYPSSAGYPSSYFEWHSIASTGYMAQVISLVCEGVFVEYPELDFVCIEGGLSWVPHVMWRLDRTWRSLRSQTPWLDRRPSEYIREHVWFTTQPMEEPADPGHLLAIFEMMGAEDRLMFSSDFPHWDGDSPIHAFPRLPEETRRKIHSANARTLYELPATDA